MQANELFTQPNTILLDGGMGTMLQAAGLKLGARPEELNITDPQLIESIHSRYAAAAAASSMPTPSVRRPISWRAANTRWKRSLRRVSPTASGPAPPTAHWPRWTSARWANCWSPTARWPLKTPWPSMAASSGRVSPPGADLVFFLRPSPTCTSLKAALLARERELVTCPSSPA